MAQLVSSSTALAFLINISLQHLVQSKRKIVKRQLVMKKNQM